MPSKKKRYNARFPAGRIKKIMQTDEEVGKVAQAVPIIISRTLELFVESLLTKAMEVTNAKNAKTLSPSHMKQCILSESRFDFLKDLVKSLPDVAVCELEDGVVQANSSSQPSTPTSNKPETTRRQQGSRIFSPYMKLPVKEDGVSCPPESTNRITPNFYTENSELAGMSYYQQTTPQLQSSTTSAGTVNPSESEDDLEELPPSVIMPQFAQPSVSIDEDYDT